MERGDGLVRLVVAAVSGDPIGSSLVVVIVLFGAVFVAGALFGWAVLP